MVCQTAYHPRQTSSTISNQERASLPIINNHRQLINYHKRQTSSTVIQHLQWPSQMLNDTWLLYSPPTNHYSPILASLFTIISHYIGPLEYNVSGSRRSGRRFDTVSLPTCKLQPKCGEQSDNALMFSCLRTSIAKIEKHPNRRQVKPTQRTMRGAVC